jgi:hypothetical protein
MLDEITYELRPHRRYDIGKVLQMLGEITYSLRDHDISRVHLNAR